MSGPRRPVTGWQPLQDEYERFAFSRRRWIFRGQRGDGGLVTTLERAVLAFYPDLARAPEIERSVCREFKRRAHQYVSTLPADEDTVEWFALMRHYGAPTRLLDWTYSFFVAAFFAIEEPADGGPYVIWAIDAEWCRKAANRQLGAPGADLDLLRQEDDPKCRRVFNEYIGREETAAVYPVNPFRMNERLTIQQGVFLCPSSVGRPFRESLDDMKPSEDVFRKLVLRVDPAGRREILEHLQRMNMDRATLFPDFEGFARSLNTKIGLPWVSDRDPYPDR